MNPIRTFLLLCTLAGLSGYSLASHAVCFSQACVQARAAATAPAVAVTPAAPTQPAAPSYSLSDDLAAATADACAPTSATDSTPIDGHACGCGQFLMSVVPNLNPNLGKVPGAITRLEQLRIIRLKLAAMNLQYAFHGACGALNMDLTADALTVEGFIATVLAK